ncbi:hypothetical protein [Roseateles chitosanitabidus]|jgi:hypothetical protein|uniref:hypothetical protein n=1 Tax=Roseateles chitosanitabidus TaxID=65048 RepID=UPI000A79D9BA|nr:hypothetical protein [Roseateles chitosanitabidus]MBO9686609.1 hypothetical protein [Roseateles chitosanitabidus]
MIKKILLSSALAAAALAPMASRAADVGVSVTIGEPGFYGTIDIGNVRPQVVYERPILVERVPRPLPAVYLRVPPGHQKNWAKHCARYNACGRPVYFVRDDWYRDVYAPRYREEHTEYRWRPDGRRDWDDRGPGRGPDRDHDRGRGHGHGRDKDRDRDDDHDRGRR